MASSEHNALELSACTQPTIQCAEHREEAEWTDGSQRVRGLHFLLTALALPVSEATHTNSPACPTAQLSMTHAPTGRREGVRDTLAAVMSCEQNVESVVEICGRCGRWALAFIALNRP